MLVRIGHLFLVVALLTATGGHWALFQTVAWTGMLSDNLRTESWSVALTRTFDGKHPCNMCKQISAGKNSEKPGEVPLQLKKLEFICTRPAFVFSAPTDFRLSASRVVRLTTRSEAPPTPPPLSA